MSEVQAAQWPALPVQDVEQDRARLEEKGKSVEYRALRMATVSTHWPQLLQELEAKKAAAAAKAAKTEARRCAPLYSAFECRKCVRACRPYLITEISCGS